MQFLWKFIDDLMGKGLPISTIAEFLVYTSAHLVPLALPLSVLLSSVMTIGNFGESFELTAMKASGLSIFKIMKPLLVFIGCLAISAFLYSNYVLPKAELKFRKALYVLTTKKPELTIPEKVFYREINNYILRVDKKDKKTGKLTDVLIYDHSNANNPRIIKSEFGYIKKGEKKDILILELHNGRIYENTYSVNHLTEDMEQQVYRFSKLTKKFDLSDFALQDMEESNWANQAKMMDIGQLETSLDSLHVRIEVQKDNFSRYFKNIFLISRDSNVLRDFDKLEPNFAYFDTIIERNKPIVIEDALNSVRNNKSYITRTTTKVMEGLKHGENTYKIEWHKKFTLSISCLILFFIGAPMGAITKKGGFGLPVVISVLFFIVYYVITITTEKMVEQTVLEPQIGMWMSSFILFPIGLFLTYRAATDTLLFDPEVFKRFSIKYFKKKKNRT